MKRNLLKIFKGTIAVAGVLLAGTNTASAQVGIGIKVPDLSAMLQVFSDNRGVLFPSVQLQKANFAGAIQEPATGLLVWNTSLDVNEFADGPGYYFNMGDKQNEKWVKLKSGAENNEAGWLLSGNNINANYYLGTNNAFPLVVKTNSTEAMRIDANQMVGIGIAPKLLGSGIRLNVDSAINTLHSYDLEGEHFAWDAGIPDNTLLGRTKNTTLSGVQNTLVGYYAGNKNTSGARNVFVGSSAGSSNLTGADNVFIGNAAGAASNGNSGAVAIGSFAGFKDNGGGSAGSVYIGKNAGKEVLTGKGNVVIGLDAGSEMKTSTGNVFIGFESGKVSGGENGGNTFVGSSTGTRNIGSGNTFIGNTAGVYNKSGSSNTFIGSGTGGGNGPNELLGNNNVAVGSVAGFTMHTASKDNAFLGANSGEYVATSSGNTIIGTRAGRFYEGDNDVENRNIFIGLEAGYNFLKGTSNLVGGYRAAAGAAGGNDNIYFGSHAGLPADKPVPPADANFIAPGEWGSTTNNSIFIGNKAGVTSSIGFLSNVVALGSDAHVGASNTIQLGAVNQKVSIGDNEGGKPQATLDVDGTVIIGKKGSIIGNVMRGNINSNLGAIAAGATAEVTIPVTGAVSGSVVFASPIIKLPNGLVQSWAVVSGSDQVKVGITNVTNGAINAPAIIFNAVVFE